MIQSKMEIDILDFLSQPVSNSAFGIKSSLMCYIDIPTCLF